MLPWEGYAMKILSRGGVLCPLNYYCKITGRLLNKNLQYIWLIGGKYLHFLLITPF